VKVRKGLAYYSSNNSYVEGYGCAGRKMLLLSRIGKLKHDAAQDYFSDRVQYGLSSGVLVARDSN